MRSRTHHLTGGTAVTTSYSYDDNGNRLTASDGTLTISATYDRLNRPVMIDDEDAGSTADTTYTYALASPSWTDPTGTYLVNLDAFDRPTSVDGPAIGAITSTYRSDGMPATKTEPSGNVTTYTYDAAGRETRRDTNGTGGVDRADIELAYNRAGQILSETSTITGDPTNGTTAYTYDPLERLTGFTRAGTATAYGWDKVPNRTSVQVGAGSPVTTTYNAANRPQDQNGVANAYASDADGRLTTQPTSAGAGFQRYEWDTLGRLTKVKDAAGTTTLATYTYDPLDRLRLVDYGGSTRTRFRYVGLTTSVAQTIDDVTSTVSRNIGTGWTGERQLDWTGTNSNIRSYGTNAHHDTVWTASSTGSVSATLRYDPWGQLTSSTGASLPDFRFQGSWHDTTTSIAWVVTRWYAPALGRFLSEDSLLGTPSDPPSRHLYAYGAGEPIGRWDPDGRWYQPEKRLAEYTIELPDWYGLAWFVATEYSCAFWIKRLPFTDFWKGVSGAGCAYGGFIQKTVSDRVKQTVYVKPFSRGANPPNGNIYTVRLHWVYWWRGVDGGLHYRGAFDERFRATQWSAGAMDRCDLINRDKGFGMTSLCLGLW